MPGVRAGRQFDRRQAYRDAEQVAEIMLTELTCKVLPCAPIASPLCPVADPGAPLAAPPEASEPGRPAPAVEAPPPIHCPVTDTSCPTCLSSSTALPADSRTSRPAPPRSPVAPLWPGAPLVGALRRLQANKELVDTRHEALATMKINGAGRWMVFFSTHPPLEARIAALENMRS